MTRHLSSSFQQHLFHFSSLLCSRTPLESVFKAALERGMGQAECNGETHWRNQLSSICFPCLMVGWASHSTFREF